MTMESPDAAQIRALLEDRAAALRAKDASAVLSHYAPDTVKFDLAPPLRTAGPAALDRRGLEGWFATWWGPLGYELRDFKVVTEGDLAFCHGVVRISGTKVEDDRKVSVWVRETVCLGKAGGLWKIRHEHSSVPFYMDGSLRAAVDLKP
jgi:ketosteroid isomerase-like protein